MQTDIRKNLSRLVEARFSSAHPHEPDTSL